MRDLNTKNISIQVLEENTGQFLYNLSTGKDFLSIIRNLDAVINKTFLHDKTPFTKSNDKLGKNICNIHTNIQIKSQYPKRQRTFKLRR